jgi:AmmeMemoRadiSam system protein A/AmmeMemoRadiSam system protein B
MRNGSSLVFCGIAPHPPIMVPEVGREAIRKVRDSIEAMAELTERVITSGAETVLLISPHAPLEPDSFVAYKDQLLNGDFANFSSPKTTVEATLDEELLQSITEQAELNNLEVTTLARCSLDHGTSVPLYFLRRNGWSGRIVAMGYSYLTNTEHLEFGECIAKAAGSIGRRLALIASGDLSHRLQPQAPAGYNPNAYRFDEQVVNAIQDNDPNRIIDIDPHLRKVAGECGYRSMLVALGALQHANTNCEVLCYEAPFGVGYLVAQLSNVSGPETGPSTSRHEEVDLGDVLPRLAREAIEAYVIRGERLRVSEFEAELLDTPAACFVSLKTLDGELRGCIGTIEPVETSLSEELVSNAIGSATRDPRFPPVTHDELDELSVSVDVLSGLEPATFADLDAEVYGVMVESEGGLRGLLLPAIEGVTSATQQVEIATRKAGIPPGSPLKIFRFRVNRFRENLY